MTQEYQMKLFILLRITNLSRRSKKVNSNTSNGTKFASSTPKLKWDCNPRFVWPLSQMHPILFDQIWNL
ncbi:hypothetical protein GJ496_010564 [Pomphorhynchus laevis]|nr:hypothetical protein GJ496_010564 [Pomphorhynchus laevis]